MPPLGHRCESRSQHRFALPPGSTVGGKGRRSQEELECRRLGELRGAPESAVHRIEGYVDPRDGLVELGERREV